MKNKTIKGLLVLFCFMNSLISYSQSNPDQFYKIYGADALLNNAESVQDLVKSSNGSSLVLDKSAIEGYIILNAHTFEHSFNRGLPSWNGSAPDEESSGFKVEMRFFVDSTWSDWLTAGYWDNYIMRPYGNTSFAYGKIDIDYVKLTLYSDMFQYKVTLKRNSVDLKSPDIRQLSFSVSDSETIANIDEIVVDDPEEIYIPTNFLYQYSIDDDIGGRICSPTSVSMVLKSFDIEVDELAFARRTYDPYWKLFGVWPRNVTHASEYGLKGAVTRYRTWSETLDVLKQGGRIAMSVGLPLYSGHLIMLAGFNSYGDPIVHDPARTDGEGHVFNKRALSESWFNKGGISYTFYEDENYTFVNDDFIAIDGIEVYPNPAVYNVNIVFELAQPQKVLLNIFDVKGVQVASLSNKIMESGICNIQWNTADNNIHSGIYFAKLVTDNKVYTKKIIINK